MSESLVLISSNVRGLRNENKRKTCFHDYRENKADIICLQETHMVEADATQWQLQWGKGLMINSYGSSNSRGVSILIANTDETKVLAEHVDTSGRYIIVHLALPVF